MADIQHNACLNGFVIALGRSLLQYADESWPWASAAEADQEATFHRLADLQRQAVAALSELLNERETIVDFGGYPTDYTDLHFVSLDYLLSRIIAGEQSNVAELEESVHTCVDDAQAEQVLQEVLTAERQILDSLQAMAAKHASTAVSAN